MRVLPGCVMVVPLRMMRVRRWSTKGRSAAAAAAGGVGGALPVPASALLWRRESCAHAEPRTHTIGQEARPLTAQAQSDYRPPSVLHNAWGMT